ncbi:MAG: TonB-dependent receptor [Sideroxydans sp.]
MTDDATAPAATLDEITVTSERSPERVGKQVISGKQAARVAGSGGDPLKGLQALPGVVAGRNGQPAVRGSGPGENAYYVDNLPFGNLFHFTGLSVLDAELVRDFNLYSAAFAPRYGDVTGAVIDVALRDPRRDRLGGKVNVSLLEADALLEGPLTPDQSFYFNARRSYVDLLLKQIERDGISLQIPNYADYRGKYRMQLTTGGILTLHLAGSSDKVQLKVGGASDLAAQQPVLVGELAFDRRTDMQALVYENLLGGSVFNQLALEHLASRNRNQVAAAGNLLLQQDSWMLREQMIVPLAERHELTLAANYELARVNIHADLKNATCTQFNPACDLTSAPRQQLQDDLLSRAWDVSAQDRVRVNERITLTGGVRHSDEDYLRRAYTEPRLGVEWEYDAATLLTAGWGRHNQMPSGQQIARTFGNPQLGHVRADHAVLGMARKLDGGWSWTAETYYKKFGELVVDDPLLNYVNGASGKAYGLEWLFRKNPGEAWSGWFSLSLSKSTRRNDITGESFRYELDQPVNATLVTEYGLAEDYTLGIRWNGHSGTPYTPIFGTQGTYPDGRPIPRYGAINSATLPPYHRLDVRLSHTRRMEGYTLDMYFEWINLYNRQNISGYSYDATYTQKKPVYEFVLPLSFGVQATF